MFEPHRMFSPHFIKSVCKLIKRLPARASVGVHDIHCGPKFNKHKLLGKLVV